MVEMIDCHFLAQMFNDNVLKINVKRCINMAIKLRKKYLYKVIAFTFFLLLLNLYYFSSSFENSADQANLYAFQMCSMF